MSSTWKNAPLAALQASGDHHKVAALRAAVSFLSWRRSLASRWPSPLWGSLCVDVKTFFKTLTVVLLCPGFSWRSPASAPPPCWRSVPSPSASSCPNSPSQVCRSASFAFRPFSPAHRSAGSATPRSPTPTPSESDPGRWTEQSAPKDRLMTQGDEVNALKKLHEHSGASSHDKEISVFQVFCVFKTETVSFDFDLNRITSGRNEICLMSDFQGYLTEYVAHANCSLPASRVPSYTHLVCK